MKKTVVISGGSDGLGKTLAENLSTDYTVIILARNKERLEKVAREIGCEYEVCDISKEDNVTSAVGHILERHQHIDILINNAGLWIEGLLETNDPAYIKEVIEVNTLGTILLTHAILPGMKPQGSGVIMNVISQAGLNAKAERSVYNASKWAITGFTKSLELEVGKLGIRVIGLYPSKIRTNMFSKMGIEKSMNGALETSEIYKLVKYILDLPENITMQSVELKDVAY